MTRLFVDTSVLVVLAAGEPGHRRIAEVLESATDLFASPLLEAEFRSALVREEVGNAPGLLESFRWVLPDQPLGPELDRVFHAGYARAADAWHLATALFLSERPRDLPFFTLDRRQREMAGALGFPTPS